MFARSINDISRVVRMMIIGDATTWSVIIESSLTIVICLFYRPQIRLEGPAGDKHSSLLLVNYDRKKFYNIDP